MKSSGIITITTDFGLTDHYVGVMKGVIIDLNPEARIIDITNCISKFAIRQANYILSQSYKYFPEGTVHLAVVDPGVGSERYPVIIETESCFFVGPDNGLFSFLKEDEIKNIIGIEKRFMEKTSVTFHGRDIFAPASALLSAGENIKNFGSKLETIEKLESCGPKSLENKIIGQILHIDSFGNLITDIKGETFIKLTKNRKISLIINGMETNDFLKNYDEAHDNFFLIEGSSGLIEISVKMGSAEKLLNAKLEEKVEIFIL